MRIIDKQHDFYDYLQDPTDTLVFDRRDSFLLTKEDIIHTFRYNSVRRDCNKYYFCLLQCGATFWLFNIIPIFKKNTFYSDKVVDYSIDFLDTWKNYNKPNKLLTIDIISFFSVYNYKQEDIHSEKIKENLKAAINHNDYKHISSLDKSTKRVDYHNQAQKQELTKPLLKACGIGNLIDPLEIFNAIEEYFSIEKTKAETTEPKGITNNDKIIMHGFDIKTSFRGK